MTTCTSCNRRFTDADYTTLPFVRSVELDSVPLRQHAVRSCVCGADVDGEHEVFDPKLGGWVLAADYESSVEVGASSVGGVATPSPRVISSAGDAPFPQAKAG